MKTVMTHLDADGVICLSLFFKKFPEERPRVYFTSPVQLRDTICLSVRNKKELGEIFIFDLANENRAIYAAALYEKVLWIDHHRWREKFDFPHVEVVVDEGAKSAARVVAHYFSIETQLVNIADEIDTNSVKSELAERIRTIIGAIRWRYSGRELTSRLLHLARILSQEDFSSLEDFKCVEEYKKWVEEQTDVILKGASYYSVAGKRVVIMETLESVPVYLLTNMLQGHEKAPFDIILVIVRRVIKGRPVTKMEFRTQTGEDVLKLARFFGGGGHVQASGASVNGIVTVPEILRAIEMLYS